MAAIPGPPQPDAAAAGPVHQAAPPEAAKLHGYALAAEKNLEALATGLAQAHADPGAVKAVSGMADMMRKLLSVMAKQAQSEPPPAPRPTIDSATRDMVAGQAAPAPQA